SYVCPLICSSTADVDAGDVNRIATLTHTHTPANTKASNERDRSLFCIGASAVYVCVQADLPPPPVQRRRDYMPAGSVNERRLLKESKQRRRGGKASDH